MLSQSTWRMRLALPALALSLLGGVGEAQISNLVKNPSFEDGTNEFPAHWSISGSPVVTEFVWDREIAHSGKRSVRLRDLGTGKSNSGFCQWVRIQGGASYVLGGFLKGESVTRASQLYIVAFDEGRNFLCTAGLTPAQDGTYDWRHVEQQFKSHPNAAWVALRCRLYGHGTLWIDDVSLAPVEHDIPQEKEVAFQPAISRTEVEPLPPIEFNLTSRPVRLEGRTPSQKLLDAVRAKGNFKTHSIRLGAYAHMGNIRDPERDFADLPPHGIGHVVVETERLLALRPVARRYGLAFLGELRVEMPHGVPYGRHSGVHRDVQILANRSDRPQRMRYELACVGSTAFPPRVLAYEKGRRVDTEVDVTAQAELKYLASSERAIARGSVVVPDRRTYEVMLEAYYPGGKTCYSSSTYRRAIRDSVDGFVGTFGSAVMGYHGFADEPNWSPTGTDGFCPICVGLFRQRLQKSYGTIEHFNRAHRTRHTAWDEVFVPEPTSHNRLWIEACELKREALAACMKVCTDAVHALVPGAIVSSSLNSAGFDRRHLGALEYRTFAECSDLTMICAFPGHESRGYLHSAFCAELMNGAAGEGRGHGAIKARGFYEKGSCPPRRPCLWLLEHVFRSVWWNTFYHYTPMGVQSGEGIPNEGFGEMWEELGKTQRQVKQLEPLLLGSVTPAAEVCMLFPWYGIMQSVGVDPSPELKGCYLAVLENKVPARIVYDVGVAHGSDSLVGYKVICLPASVCLHRSVAAQVREAVRQGATLIAEEGVGSRDEYGEQQHLLKDLFTKESQGLSRIRRFTYERGLVYLFPRATGARNHDVYVQNGHTAGDAAVREVVRRILDEAGVARYVIVEADARDDLPHIEALLRVADGYQLLALLNHGTSPQTATVSIATYFEPARVLDCAGEESLAFSMRAGRVVIDEIDLAGTDYRILRIEAD